jgi:hypothetical protein
VAATASGGETIAPIRNDNGQLRPAISQCAVSATSTVVKKTSPIDARLIGLKAALKSRQLVFHAAPYNNGGRKIINTTVGSKVTMGKPGIRLITTPDNTSIIGNGNLYLLLTTPKKVIPKSSTTIRFTFSIF